MSNDEWTTAIRLRLGLPLSFIPHNCTCICKKKVDLQGYHFFTCKHGGERIALHNDICTQFFAIARSAGIAGKLEPPLHTPTGAHRADIALFNPELQRLPEYKNHPPNSDIIGDIKVSFPCADSYISKGSHSKAGFTAAEAYGQKISKYNRLDVVQGRVFIPISIESFGRFHPSVKPLISAMCSKASSISGVSRSVLSNYWINRISVILQKNISKMLLSRVDKIVSKDLSLQSSFPKYGLPSFDDLKHPRIRAF
jgi:hypothetical protein